MPVFCIVSLSRLLWSKSLFDNVLKSSAIPFTRSEAGFTGAELILEYGLSAIGNTGCKLIRQLKGRFEIESPFPGRNVSHNNFKYNTLARVAIFLVFAYTLIPGSLTAGENSLLRLENGLEIRLYTSEDIMAMTSRDTNGRLILQLPGGISYELVDDILDPQIVNKGDGSFHPVSVDWVIDALAKVDVLGARVSIPVHVYVLPLPRSGFLASSACGGDIFLSPGVYEVGRRVVACTATHELGHVFQHHFAPERNGENWPEYLKLRGIEDEAAYSAEGPRMNRPVEIFAEDFRYLFGGSEACYSGKIENPDLPTPDDVRGLEEFFVALVAPVEIASAGLRGAAPFSLSNYPNPFNPSTTIRVERNGSAPADGVEIDVSIYRVDGSLVRNLYQGLFAGDELSVPWDGRDAQGRAVPSGVYLYAVRQAEQRATGKLLLMR